MCMHCYDPTASLFYQFSSHEAASVPGTPYTTCTLKAEYNVKPMIRLCSFLQVAQYVTCRHCKDSCRRSFKRVVCLQTLQESCNVVAFDPAMGFNPDDVNMSSSLDIVGANTDGTLHHSTATNTVGLPEQVSVPHQCIPTWLVT